MKRLLEMTVLGVLGNIYVYKCLIEHHVDLLAIGFIFWWTYILIEGVIHYSTNENDKPKKENII